MSKSIKLSRTHHSSSHSGQPTFHVSSADYDIVFVNHNISINTLHELLIHVQLCKQYSIDTESERDNNKLSLIQINSIPSESKTFVLLFELNYLPDRQSEKYEKICELFRLIFRKNNEVYSWGNMEVELEPAKELFNWPIPASLINIQPHFSNWYNWARTQCRVRGLSYRTDINGDRELIQQSHHELACSCHPPSPYRINELWSLQRAFKYGCNLFIDKSCTLSHWSSSLTSSHSSLSKKDQANMIHYATHDVMAVTFLIRPITEKWTFEKITNSKIREIFRAFNSVELPPLTTITSTKKKIKNINTQSLSKILTSIDPDVEPISSDDEIYLHQLIEPVTNDSHPENQVKNNNLINDVEINVEVSTTDIIMNDNTDEVTCVNSHIVDVDEMFNLAEQQQPRCKKHRSITAKRKRNRKRNMHIRLTRYKHSFTRPCYYKFKSKNIRNILRHYGIQFRHIKFLYDRVIIGVKNDKARRDYEEALPYNCFNKNNYQVFSK